MGNAFSLCSSKPLQADVFMSGLDASGKTLILYSIVLGKAITTIPTIICNIEIYKSSDKVEMKLFDQGGGYVLRLLSCNYWNNLKGMIFVFDSNDKKRIKEAEEEMKQMCDYPNNKGVPLLVFANKQDIESAYSANELENIIEIDRESRDVLVIGCCAKTGEGIQEGIKWLNDKIIEKYVIE